MKGYSGGNKLKDEEMYDHMENDISSNQIDGGGFSNQNISARIASGGSPVLTNAGGAAGSMTQGDIID
jgi:hypothetical protein